MWILYIDANKLFICRIILQQKYFFDIIFTDRLKGDVCRGRKIQCK